MSKKLLHMGSLRDTVVSCIDNKQVSFDLLNSNEDHKEDEYSICYNTVNVIYCNIEDYVTNGYQNTKIKIGYNFSDTDDGAVFYRSFVFLQPYGDYDIPDKFWKRMFYKEMMDHCCAVDEYGIVYVVYLWKKKLYLDAFYKIDSDIMLNAIMNGNINHKRPYRFTFDVDDLMAFIMKEYGYDELRHNIKVKFNLIEK